MEITLYINTSSEKQVYKNLTLFKKYDTSYLKFPTDILNPTIRITDQLESGVLDCNYAYIKDFGRYYFISNITIFNNETIDIYLTVDVMMSWWNEFKLYNMLIGRCEDWHSWDDEVIDNQCSFKQGVVVTNVGIPTNPDDDVFNWDDSVLNYLCVIMTNQDTRTSNIIDLPQTNINIPKLDNKPMGAQINNAPYMGGYALMKWLLGEMIHDATARSFVKYCKVLPINIPYLPGTALQPDFLEHEIYVGDNPMPVTTPLQVYFPKYTVLRYKIAEFTFNEYLITGMHTERWLRKSPYSKYELFVPFYGFVELNYDMCYGETLKLYYFFNIDNGESYAIITRSSDNRNIWSDSVNLGIDVPLDGSNGQEQEQVRRSAEISGAIKGTIGAMTTIAGIALCATGYGAGAGVGMIAGGVGSAASGAIESMKTSMTTFVYGQTSVTSGTMGVINGLKAYIRFQKMVPEVDYFTSEFNHLKGKPSHIVSDLTNQDLGPFVQVDECEIKCGTLKEQEEIERRLKEGVYL